MIDNNMCNMRRVPGISLRMQPLIIRPVKIVFNTIFVFAFCLSGFFTILTIMVGGFQYRLGLTSVLILPLLLMCGVNTDSVFFTYLILGCVVVLSGLFNATSFYQIFLFMRILGFSWLIYWLVVRYIRPHNIVRVMRICVWVAIFQLPALLLQRMTYGLLPLSVKSQIAAIDYDFGTFNFKGDASMTLFSILIVVFLLFDNKRNYIVRRRWLVAAWLTVTVLVANAEIAKFVIVAVWGILLLVRFRSKNLLYIFGLLFLIASVLGISGRLDDVWIGFRDAIISNLNFAEGKEASYLSGGYGRGAALSYYWSQGVSFFGDGPSKYYDVFSRTRIRGNMGHAFTFYSEVGLLGWLTSVIAMALMAFTGRKGRLRLQWVPLLSFIVIQLFGFTIEIMNDISIILIYCIITRSYLIPVLDSSNVACRDAGIVYSQKLD